jgi:hypothetical protein
MSRYSILDNETWRDRSRPLPDTSQIVGATERLLRVKSDDFAMFALLPRRS